MIAHEMYILTEGCLLTLSICALRTKWAAKAGSKELPLESKPLILAFAFPDVKNLVIIYHLKQMDDIKSIRLGHTHPFRPFQWIPRETFKIRFS